MPDDTSPRTPRFRFRIGTLLLVIAVLALLLVVVVQQVQMERMRQRAAVLQKQVDQAARDRDVLTIIVREQRDMLERSSGRQTPSGGAPEAPRHR
jgi:hypothetical protein